MAGGEHDAGAQPLRNVVLCSTSLSQELRTKLAELASSLGATHRLDLTADVTHLIVGNIDTPKYKHTAKERPDIEVLRPEWMEAILEAWRADKDIDLEDLVQEHRLPPFYKLHICVTGFEDIEERQRLITNIENNGAIYHGDLTRDVTHLIVARPKGAKYDRAKTWGMQIVSLKWLEEGLERGMALDETLYHPLLPFEDQGQGAFIRGYQKNSVLGKRRRDDGSGPAKEDAGKRRLRRTASTRLGNHSQNLWADISFAEDDDAGKTNDQWVDPRAEATGPESVSHDETLLIAEDDGSRPVTRGVGPAAVQAEPGFLAGTLCLAHGHNEKHAAKIHEIVIKNGGRLAQSPGDLFSAVDEHTYDQGVLVLPSGWTSTTMGSVPEVPEGTWRVTEWWFERCIVAKSIIDPKDDVLSRPHLHLPVDGFQGLSISTSGLGEDVMHLSKFVRLLGASYREELSSQTSVLIIPSGTANIDKVRYASQRRIPVVSIEWLWSSIARGQKLPMSDYPATHSKQHHAHPLDREETTVQQQERSDSLRKDDTHVQRLSATRKRGVAPSLRMVKPKAAQVQAQAQIEVVDRSNPQGEKRVPFLEDDGSSDDERSDAARDVTHAEGIEPCDQPTVLANDTVVDGQSDGAASPQALQELPPEMNSPRKQSADLSTGSNKETPGEPLPAPGDAAWKEIAPEEGSKTPVAESSESGNARLQGEIESLLERQHLAPAPAETDTKGRRRKERKLGRAASMISNSSASTSFRQNTSMEVAGSLSAEQSVPEDVGAPMPSQQLTYETPDAQEYRARMSKKMGTKLMDDGIGRRVESIGVVRDVDTGGGGRSRGRHRSAKNNQPA